MAAGSILTVLSQVPWGQVIDAAPKVAEGASKLWKAVRRRNQEDEAPLADLIGQATEAASSGAPDALLALRAEVERMQSELAGLRAEMQAATGLIKDLADQNSALVQRIELNRRRLLRLAIACALLGGGLVVAVGYLFGGG